MKQRRARAAFIVLMACGMLILVMLAAAIGGSGSRPVARPTGGNTPSAEVPRPTAAQPTLMAPTPSKTFGSSVTIEIQRQANVIFIPVASEGMRTQINGIAKLEILQVGVGSLIGAISGNLRIGLLNYTSTSTPPNCQSISLRSPLSADKKRIVDNLKGIQVSEGAAIAEALQGVEVEFRPGEENYVILLADTTDSCGGDAVRAAEFLQQSDVAATIFTVGLAPSREAQEQLTHIALASGGKYYLAANGVDLNSVLTQILGDIRAVTDPGRVYLNAGKVLVAKTRLDDAIRKFALSVQAQSNFVEGYAWWGRALSLKAQALDGADRAAYFAQASEKAQKALELAKARPSPSGEAMALNVLGDLAYEMHDYAGAIERYRAALIRDSSPDVAPMYQQNLAKAQAALKSSRCKTIVQA
jgi:hypothetical protein